MISCRTLLIVLVSRPTGVNNQMNSCSSTDVNTPMNSCVSTDVYNPMNIYSSTDVNTPMDSYVNIHVGKNGCMYYVQLQNIMILY